LIGCFSHELLTENPIGFFFFFHSAESKYLSQLDQLENWNQWPSKFCKINLRVTC
jgi:hypothetical protein